MPTMTTNTDRIEKQILLRAPRARVWPALTDADEFGSWFGVKLDGPFIAGAIRRGVIVGTTADADVAKLQREHKDVPFEITIDRIEPERLFSFRWHPFAIDRGVDYSAEPTTLITFTLEKIENGTILTVTEAGFDRIPLERRVKAFTANERGWTIQMSLIEKHLQGEHKMDFDVNVRERILKPVNEVFEAVVDTKKMSNYFISGASGPIKVGRVQWEFGDVGAKVSIDVLEVENNRKIVWDVERPGPADPDHDAIHAGR